jgi:hypothetical protein
MYARYFVNVKQTVNSEWGLYVDTSKNNGVSQNAEVLAKLGHFFPIHFGFFSFIYTAFVR